MIIIKHVTPKRCKILRTLGFTSISRMGTHCIIGVKPYKGCRKCENNLLEIITENLQLEDGKKSEWIEVFKKYSYELKGGAE